MNTFGQGLPVSFRAGAFQDFKLGMPTVIQSSFRNDLWINVVSPKPYRVSYSRPKQRSLLTRRGLVTWFSLSLGGLQLSASVSDQGAFAKIQPWRLMEPVGFPRAPGRFPAEMFGRLLMLLLATSGIWRGWFRLEHKHCPPSTAPKLSCPTCKCISQHF